MSSSTSTYDFIIFGASGFTGKFIVKYLLSKNYTIAMAGRSESKLNSIKSWLLKETSPSASLTNYINKIDIIIADTADYSSLIEMCKQGKIIISAVGPYRFYGEQVVKACIETKCDYVDITGEPEFIDKMILKYNQDAIKNNCHIIFSCGFDSIPADMGYDFTLKNYNNNGICNSIDAYLTLNTKGQFHGHYTTWQAAVEGVGAVGELKQLRKDLNTALPLPAAVKAGVKSSYFMPFLEKYVLPFPGSDASVVRDSQRLLSYFKLSNSFPKYSAYFTLSTWFWLVIVMFFGFIFTTLAKFSWGRSLLLAYPSFFSFGAFNHEGPSDEDLRNTSFQIDMFAYGNANVLHTRVSGPEPGYVATPIFAVEAASVLLEKSKFKLPTGGCLTPAVAFGNTNYRERLMENGIKFEVIND